MRKTVFGKFGSKNQNFQFKLNFDTYTKFEYAEFNGGAHFFCFREKTHFLSKFGPKNENCHFKLIFGT